MAEVRLVGKTGMKEKIVLLEGETLEGAMPEIVTVVRSATEELAPKRTGKMASKIEGKVEYKGANTRGTITPRGRIAHLVHNPTRDHSYGIGGYGPVWKAHRAVGFQMNTGHGYHMRFFSGGAWHFSRKIHRLSTPGRPFLEWALTMTQADVNEIIQRNADRKVEEAIAE